MPSTHANVTRLEHRCVAPSCAASVMCWPAWARCVFAPAERCAARSGAGLCAVCARHWLRRRQEGHPRPDVRRHDRAGYIRLRRGVRGRRGAALGVTRRLPAAARLHAGSHAASAGRPSCRLLAPAGPGLRAHSVAPRRRQPGSGSPSHDEQYASRCIGCPAPPLTFVLGPATCAARAPQQGHPACRSVTH